MQLEGEQQFTTSPPTIWEAVFDPAVLEKCIPGAQTVEQVSDTLYEGEIVRGLASITVTMDLTVEIVEDNRPSQVVLHLEGIDNRINSTVDGTATIQMATRPDTPTLKYTVDLAFTGRLVSLGSRMIKRQLNHDLDRFFDDLTSVLAEQQSSSGAS